MERQFLEDIFVTALEGGSNYWYHITAETNQKIRKLVPRSEDPYLATAMLTAILDHGARVEVHDAENPDEILGILSYEDMKERLEDLDNSLDYRWALEAHQEEVGDAESADIVFQYLVMGEVWFS
jgi:hypothetical protein